MKPFIIAIATAIVAASCYKLGVIRTTARVDIVLLHQSKLKVRDATYWLLATEFPEDVE